MTCHSRNLSLLSISAAAALLLGCTDDSRIKAEPSSGGSGATSASGGSPATGGAGGSGGGAAAAGGSAAGGSGGTGAVACPTGGAGAKQILIQTPSGAAYCIDQREVTRGEYKAFLDAKSSDVSGQPPGCSWNERYAPLIPDPPDEGGFTCPDWDLTKSDYPVGCVDICDAFAYCKWAGKRLCGVIGADSSDIQKVSDPKQVGGSLKSEWAYACTQAGSTTYPYGDKYEAATCIDKPRIDANGLAAQAATTEAQESCHGTMPPFDTIFHMSGSVQEWMNICDPAFGTECVNGGGSWNQPADYLACSPPQWTFALSDYVPGHGVRCCADAVAVSSP